MNKKLAKEIFDRATKITNNKGRMVKCTECEQFMNDGYKNVAEEGEQPFYICHQCLDEGSEKDKYMDDWFRSFSLYDRKMIGAIGYLKKGRRRKQIDEQTFND